MTPPAGGGLRRLAAPAKINLGLRIVGRRPDGYHRLESLFLPLDLADELELEVEPADAGAEPRVELALAAGDAPGSVPDDARNLAVRAARAFLDTAGLRARVRVHLHKRVPAAAGLGGGSSDAAAVLRGLAALFPDALDAASLAELALGLGADVPFFLDPRPAWVAGVGERVEPVAGVPALDVVLAHPGVAVSTAEVYAAWDALHPAAGSDDPGAGRRALAAWLADGGPRALAALARNDLEAPAVRLCPPVARLRTALAAAGAVVVGMSGSGASVYGVFSSGGAAGEAAARLARDPGSAAITGGCAVAGAWFRVARTVGSG